MKYDNLRLVDIDADGDLDILTTEEGAGVLTSGKGVLWLENPLHPAAPELSDAFAEQPVPGSVTGPVIGKTEADMASLTPPAQ